jgi:hypothetical protein
VKREFSLLRTILTGFCLVAACQLASADTIRLKDGSVYKGKVTSYNQRKFTITIYVGSSASQHVIPVEEIESVEFDGDMGATAAAKPAAETSTPPPLEKPRFEVAPTQPTIARPTETPVTTAPRETAAPPTNVAANPPTVEPMPSPGDIVMEKTVNIAAAADWTDTGLRIQRGQRIQITATGEVDLGPQGKASPNGVATNDASKLMKSRPTGALIAVVGDDNDDFMFIGATGEFIATHNGALFLSVNEGKLEDNRGSFIAKVKVLSR